MSRRFQFSLRGMLRVLIVLVFCVLVVAQFIGMEGIAWIVAAEFWLVACIWGLTIIKSQGGPRFQFSLRALLVIMLVVAAFFSGATWELKHSRDERAASWRAKERGLNQRVKELQEELKSERNAWVQQFAPNFSTMAGGIVPTGPKPASQAPRSGRAATTQESGAQE